MLADPRSQALVTNFAAQWLYLRNLQELRAGSRRVSRFRRQPAPSACARETEMFFESIVHEDRNVLDLLNANYTFVNERLAKHYGIPDVYGPRFPPRDAHRRCAPRTAGAGKHSRR